MDYETPPTYWSALIKVLLRQYHFLNYIQLIIASVAAIVIGWLVLQIITALAIVWQIKKTMELTRLQYVLDVTFYEIDDMLTEANQSLLKNVQHMIKEIEEKQEEETKSKEEQ